jgi:hypothetical protein
MLHMSFLFEKILSLPEWRAPRFAHRHRQALSKAVGLEYKRWPSEETFVYLYHCAEA